MIVIGCDPGTTGAIAAICSVRGFLEVERLPVVDRGKGSRKVNFVDAAALRSMLREWSSAHRFAADELATVIERTHAGSQMGGSSVLQMGHSAGIVEGVFACTLASPTLVTPTEWKRFYGIKSDKKASVDIAKSLYPNTPKVLAHDKAEAILIAHWLMAKVNGDRIAA